jgi:hypothetical protein
MAAAGGPKQWISLLLQAGSKEEKKRNLGILLTFWWTIWKERNNFFYYKEVSAVRLAQLVIEDVKLHNSVLSLHN